MSIRSFGMVVVAVFVITMCYSLPTNNVLADATAIIGGDKVHTPLPYHVQIQYPIPKHTHYCYGTLLTSNFVGAPVYQCLEDFEVKGDGHSIHKVGTNKNGNYVSISGIRKKCSRFYNIVNLMRNIGVVEVKPFNKGYVLPSFKPINSHLPEKSDVHTYGFGSLFSTGNENLQRAQSITATSFRTRLQYPIKTNNYTIGIEVNRNAADSLDIGSPIMDENNLLLVGLVVYSDHDKWVLKHDTIILGQEICGVKMGKKLEEWTKTKFCSEQKYITK